MRVLCFGDSNTYGYDPRSCFGSRYDPGACWVELLAELTGWEVVNAGLCGRRIPQRPYEIRRVRALLSAHEPDLLLVMLGTNDLLQGLSASESCARMERFLAQLSAPRVLLVAPPAMKRGPWVTEDRLVVESVRLGEAYGRLSAHMGLSFADAGPWNVDLAFDGVHFSQEGHKAFAKELARKFLLVPPFE